jgi:hypothetical protein
MVRRLKFEDQPEIELKNILSAFGIKWSMEATERTLQSSAYLDFAGAQFHQSDLKYESSQPIPPLPPFDKVERPAYVRTEGAIRQTRD